MTETTIRERLAAQYPVLHRGAQQVRGAADRVLDLSSAVDGTKREAGRLAKSTPRQSILVIGVYEPDSDMPGEISGLKRSRHEVQFALGSRKGLALPRLREETRLEDMHGLMLENANLLLEAARDQATSADWIIRIDSDVRFPPRFVDRFIAIADALDFAICSPALTRRSYRGWDVTRRQPASLARETNFVEIGPVCAFRRDAAERLLPFPETSGMGWGLDLHWPAVAEQNGWRLGIVDATPIRHERFPWSTYSFDDASRAERSFLASRPHIDRGAVRTLNCYRRAS